MNERSRWMKVHFERFNRFLTTLECSSARRKML